MLSAQVAIIPINTLLIQPQTQVKASVTVFHKMSLWHYAFKKKDLFKQMMGNKVSISEGQVGQKRRASAYHFGTYHCSGHAPRNIVIEAYTMTSTDHYGGCLPTLVFVHSLTFQVIPDG